MSKDVVVQDGIGIIFEIAVVDSTIDLPYVLTGFTSLEIIFTKPDGSKLTKVATAPIPTNGKMEYTTIVGDLNLAGWWKMQGHIVGPGTIDYYTKIHEFRVHERL